MADEATPVAAPAAEAAPAFDEAAAFTDAVSALTASETDAAPEAAPGAEPAGAAAVAPAVEGGAPAAAQPDMSKTEYYSKLAEADRQQRLLKRELREIKEKQTQVPEVPDYAAMAKEKPMEVLDRLGLSLDQILEAASGTPPTPEAPARPSKELQALQAKYDQLERDTAAVKAHIEGQSAQQQLNYELAKIKEVTEAGAQNFEYINATLQQGSLQLVLQTTAAMYQEALKDDPYAQPPSYSAVAPKVEAYLREQEIERLNRLRNLSFLQAHLTQSGNGVNSNGAAAKTSQQKSPATPPQTLSSGEDTPTPRELTEDENFQLALKELMAE